MARADRHGGGTETTGEETLPLEKALAQYDDDDRERLMAAIDRVVRRDTPFEDD